MSNMTKKKNSQQKIHANLKKHFKNIHRKRKNQSLSKLVSHFLFSILIYNHSVKDKVYNFYHEKIFIEKWRHLNSKAGAHAD